MAYRVPAQPESQLRATIWPHYSRAIVGALVFAIVMGFAFSVLLQMGRMAVAVLAMFGPIALVMGALRLRSRIRVFDDRVEQGPLFRRTIPRSEVRHVFTSKVSDPFAHITAVTAYSLSETLLVGASGTRIALPGSVPEPLRTEVIEDGIKAAVDFWGTQSRYFDPDKLSGLDGAVLHGFRVGLTVKKVSAPLDQVASVSATGIVHLVDGTTFSIGSRDAVLRVLLTYRGVMLE